MECDIAFIKPCQLQKLAGLLQHRSEFCGGGSPAEAKHCRPKVRKIAHFSIHSLANPLDRHWTPLRADRFLPDSCKLKAPVVRIHNGRSPWIFIDRFVYEETAEL